MAICGNGQKMSCSRSLLTFLMAYLTWVRWGWGWYWDLAQKKVSLLRDYFSFLQFPLSEGDTRPITIGHGLSWSNHLDAGSNAIRVF